MHSSPGLFVGPGELCFLHFSSHVDDRYHALFPRVFDLTSPDSSNVFFSQSVPFSPVCAIRTDGGSQISNASAAETWIAHFSKPHSVSVAHAVQMGDEPSGEGKVTHFSR
jgi:hypothetical protein